MTMHHENMWASVTEATAVPDASVTCTLPLVSRYMSQLSTVPQANLPDSAAARAPGTCSKIQAIFVALK